MEVPLWLSLVNGLELPVQPNMSQQQALADIIGKSLNTVGLYERGLRQPSLETLCLLADTLEVSSDYLLARTDVKRTATFSRRFRKRSGGARGQNRESSGAELNKGRPPAGRRGRRFADGRALHARFCRNDEKSL